MLSFSRIIFLFLIFIRFDRFSIVFSQIPQCNDIGNIAPIRSLTGLLNINLMRNKPVVVGFMIEMLCPFSRQFFVNQWCPIRGQLEPCLKIDYIVSGNRDRSNARYTCQHGFKECAYNQDVRNVISLYSNSQNGQSIVGCYICCIFSNDKRDTNYDTCSQQCARQCGINYNSCRNLRNTTQSMNTWLKHDSFTLNTPGYHGTPCIGFCNSFYFDTSITDDFQDNLKETICRVLGTNSRCCGRSNLSGFGF